MKHNISITMDSQLFREIENTRGREKRSTFIEHLIITGLKTYKNKKEENAADANQRKAPIAFLSPVTVSHTKH
jgi:metal-responsive CopG/Arc/MetJ family transcriptional regulator